MAANFGEMIDHEDELIKRYPIRRITAIRSMEKACMQNMEHASQEQIYKAQEEIISVLISNKISSALTVEIQ